VALLQQECAKEKKQNLQAEATAGDLAVEVAAGRAEIARLNGEMSKLQDQVNGKTSLSLTVLSKFLAGLLKSLACV
jgi:predicted  nucleic acid-binding Zn-ribbon protein